MNLGADLLSRGTPLYADWTLHPRIVSQLWVRYGRAAVDLFASKDNAQCQLFFAMHLNAPLGVDTLAHDWPRAFCTRSHPWL
ncbi:hypothetical protein CgunFtcFv8_014130 [Champsocephalus gunnari]|uniref:Uncharacterized protein n=1 Tax=Champsocephalus gunnari TaxID=52237 RepID=A0AAN8HZK9_CHAGU|nr:hypothetical protein CgunFtcFv8_014130 [Champsocephalus gunnari]